MVCRTVKRIIYYMLRHETSFAFMKMPSSCVTFLEEEPQNYWRRNYHNNQQPVLVATAVQSVDHSLLDGYKRVATVSWHQVSQIPFEELISHCVGNS